MKTDFNLLPEFDPQPKWPNPSVYPVLGHRWWLIGALLYALILGSIFGQVATPTPDRSYLTQMGRHESQRRSHHRHPTSTFVLPEVTRGAPPSAEEKDTARFIRGFSPDAVSYFDERDPVYGTRTVEFFWVNNLEEYEAIPVGMWLEDPQGNVAKKQDGLTNGPGTCAQKPNRAALTSRCR